MTDLDGAAGNTASSTRLEEFGQEVGRLKLRGGSAEPERKMVAIGAVVFLLGLIVGFVAYGLSHQTKKVFEQNDYIIIASIGVSLSVIGAVIWLRHSFTAYLRYWLVRLIYEDRDQTDRLVNVLERLEARLGESDRTRV